MEELVTKANKAIRNAYDNNVVGASYHEVSVKRSIRSGSETAIVRACHQAITALEVAV